MAARFSRREEPPYRPSGEPPESRLIAGIQAGDEVCLEHLIRRYWDPLVDYSLQVVGDPDRAADIVQAAFVRLWQGRQEWTNSETLRPLLYRMVRNASLNSRRDRAAFREWVRTFPPSERDPRPSPLKRAEGNDLLSAAQEALETLPERRREIFVLVRFHHLTYREAADALDVSPQTVANQVSLAMRDLREALQEYLPPHDTSSSRGNSRSEAASH